MSGIRKLLYVLGVVVAFAVSDAAFAQVKNFSVSASPAFAPPGTTTNETVTWLNSASGNSNMNSVSLALQLPVGVTFTIVSVDSGTPSISGSTISVINMNSIKPGKTFKMTLAITVPGGAVCSGASSWTGKAWTGNTLGGTQFTPTSGSVAQVYVGCNGTLACATDIAPADLNPVLDGTQHAKIGRGPKDFDSSTSTTSDCTGQAVPYSTDFIMLGSQTLAFDEVSNGQHPVTEYLISWNAVDLSAWPDCWLRVAWCGGAFIDALSCLSDDLSNPGA